MPKTPAPRQVYDQLTDDFGWMRANSYGTSLIRLDWNQTGWLDQDALTMFHVKQNPNSSVFGGHLQKFILPPRAHWH